MNILLLSATGAEIMPLTEHLTAGGREQAQNSFKKDDHSITIFVTGVGMVATTYALTKIVQQQKFDLILQAGIAGSFIKDLALGEVVLVEQEMFGDLGAEDRYNFIDSFELGLADENEFPFQQKKLVAHTHPLFDKFPLRKVSSLSVNTVSGSSFTATARYEKFHADIENMEGAAFHYVCLQEKIPFVQIRSISNYVETRDKSKWKISKAITNLNALLIKFFQEL
ncbi:MAG TPA: futalosine hydrolase [Flavipsychrobacter sp.]|nr:futalosine hydrolase [Flavipsychrobacter sp.]